MVEASKVCEVCGRKIDWRAKWSKNWHEVRYCGEKCRRNKSTLKLGYEQKIIQLLSERAESATICPSEVLPLELKQDPIQMELVRQAARRLVHNKWIVIVQNNKVVDPSSFRGPIRLKRVKV